MNPAWNLTCALLLATTVGGAACKRPLEATPATKKHVAREAGPEAKAPSEAVATKVAIERCERERDGVLLTEHWADPAGDLELVGTVIGKVKSDVVFDLYSTNLLFLAASDDCITGRVAVGELTVARGEAFAEGPDAPARLQKLRVGDQDVALLWLVRDVKWGLTTEYVVPVSVSPLGLIAGERVLARRDSMGGDVFFSEASVADVDGDGSDEIVLDREGRGSFAPRVIIRRGADGSFSVKEAAGARK